MANQPAADSKSAETQKTAQEAKPNAGKETKGKVEELIVPLVPGRFGLTRHRARQFRANVPNKTSKAQLENGRFWAHVAGQLGLHDEVRVVADDTSFTALLMVTFKYGNNIRLKIIDYTELEVVDYAAESGLSDFFVENRGAVGWCVIAKESGEIVFSHIPTQPAAYAKLDEHVRALSQ